MKMKSMFSGLGAKMALATLALGMTMTSCYDSESVDIVGPAELPDPEYVICVNVTSSTGEALPDGSQVTLDGTNTQTLTDGAYIFEDVTPGSHTLVVDIDGYLRASRTVYLQTVQDGESCVAVADIVLYDASTQVTEPEYQAPATTEQAQEVLEASETQITELLTAVEGLDAESLTIELDENGNIVASSDVSVSGGTPGNTVTVQVPSFTGFASTITPDTDLTKGLTPAQIWVASAEAALNRTYGLQRISVNQTLPASGKATIIGYNFVITLNTEALQFDGTTGVVTYQENVVVATPIYDSHDSHDSHDQHGGSNGAGGGEGGDQ